MKSTHLLLSAFIFSVAGLLQAQVTGTVFRDFNGDGIKQANEPLVSGITVNVYNASNALCATAVTAGATAPNYSAAGCGTAPVRVEFILPTSGACAASDIDFSAISGAVYGSSVQFVNGNSTNVNYTIHYNGNYNSGSSATNMFIPCYVNGDPLGGGNSGTQDWFVGFPYLSSGTTPPTLKVNGTQLGATWGTAYSRQAGVIFTSAFIKRHVGLGPLGSGGIYLLTPSGSTFTVTPFYDMDANGYRTRAGAGAPAYGNGSSFQISGPNNNLITFLGAIDPASGAPEGLGVVGANGAGGRNLPAVATTANYDPAAFGQVGKAGLGGMDISPDGRYLFVMNLYDRRLYRLELNNPYAPTGVVSVSSYALPSGVSCTNGVLRPFAVRFYRGKVYVGAVCSGENGGSNTVGGPTDLYAYVFELNNATSGSASFSGTPVLSYPLNYQKGAARADMSSPYQGRQWYPWVNDADAVLIDPGDPGFGTYPSPMLTDLEFTDRGDITMAFTDRGGHIWGTENYQRLASSTLTIEYIIGGDILVAGINCSTGVFSLENNGSFSSSGTSFSGAPGNNQGPGGGEFFHREEYDGNNPHQETGQGSTSNLFGQGGVMATVMDPTGFFSGGTRRFSTADGSLVASSSYRLYTGFPAFSKANGLGDLSWDASETPIEIGNRVWDDLDADGVQDAHEPGIAGVPVELYKETSPGVFTLISSATTDANGNYYFSSGPGTSTSSFKYGVSQLQPNMSYELRFPTTVGALNLTVPNNGGLDPNADERDSDANAAGVVAFSTGGPGANNHSYDAGYFSCTQPSGIVFSTTPATCSGSSANNNGSVVLTSVTNGTHFGVSSLNAVTYDGPASIPLATPIGGLPQTIVSAVPNTGGTYIVRIFNGADNCYEDQTVTVAANPCCNLSLTATAACQPGNNGQYNLTVTLNYQNSPGGVINVSLSTGQTQSSSATMAGSSGSVTVTFTGLVNTGATGIGITASFAANPGCMATGAYDAPANCCPPPYPLCPGESYTFTAEPGFTNYQWYFNGNPIPGATNQTYVANQLGSYTWTADNMGCPTGNCCPIVLTPGTNCCSIAAINPNVICNNNNTGNPNDDFYSITVNPTGTGIGTQYTVVIVHNSTTYNFGPFNYGSPSPALGTFLISQGNATVTVNDVSNSGCSLGPVTVTAPVPCSVPMSIGSLVWVDDLPGLNATDNNGMRDAGEPGLPNVVVRLYGVGPDGIKGTADDFEINVGPDGLLGTSDDAPGGVLTNASGVYFFGYLDPGSYYVVLPVGNFASGGPAAAYQLSSTPTNTNDDQMDDDDNGIQMSGPGGLIMSPIIVLLPNTEPTNEPGAGGNQDLPYDNLGDMTVDFGFVPMVTLGSTVFLDDQPGLNATDNNGVQDGGEPGIAGVAVELWSVGADGVKGTADDSKFEVGPDGVLGTADDGLGDHVTNASGNYFFSGIPEGIYYVKIQSTQFASGGPLAGSPLSSAVVNGTPEDNTDSDNNGVQMGGQGGMVMSNPVTLIAGTEPVGGAEPGQGGTQDDAHPYADANGNMTVDFGFVPAVSVGSVVFADYDNDGVYEPSDGENGISGVVLELYSPGANGIKENGGGDDVLVGTTTTDATGVYFFGGLYEGPYYILIGNSQFGTGNALSGHVSSSDIGTTATDNTTDNDDNGLAMGLVGTPSYVVMSPLFNLVAGTEPVGTAENGPGGTQDDSHPQVDANGDMTKDFGFVPTLSLGSTVWLDDQPGLNATDNNGMQDSGEPGISGVTVRLYGVGSDGIKGTVDDVEINVGPDGVLGTADDGPGGMLTDATGNYFFTSLLPGNYYVVLPASNFASGGPLGSYQLSSTPNNPNDDQMDSDNNGLQMGGPGGVVMSGVITLASGTEPAGEPGQGGNQDAGNDDSGDMTVDFGFVPMVTLGSTVFLDDQPGLNATDNNGVQDGGEPGIAGVAVELWSVGADGVKGTADDSKFEVGPDGVLGTADDGLGDHVTNASGNYFFSGIPEGIYYVKIQSTQFASGGPLAGSPLSSAVVNGTPEDNTDSDNNGVQMGGQGGMVMSNPVTLIAGTEPVGGAEPGQGGTQDDAHPYADANGNMTVDFGFVPAVSVGSVVFADYDNDGVYEPSDGENGISGVVLELYSPGANGIKENGGGDDVLAGTTTTDATGVYFFGGLYEGPYYILIGNSQFGTGNALSGHVSSSDIGTTATDNTTDNDDNGLAMGLVGTPSYVVMSPLFNLVAGTEPVGTAENGPGGTQDDGHPQVDANGDMTKDFGFVPTLSLGSTVWLDDQPGLNATDNNGMQDSGEPGISGVTVRLYGVGPDGIKGTADDVEINVGPDGVLGTADDGPGGMLTDATGNYFFTSLLPGNYYVVLPSSNFASGGPLGSYQLSSTPNNPNDDQMDSDNNGLQMGGPGGVVMSGVITLASGTEPAGEPGQGGNQDAGNDDSGDMTVDFGFVPMVTLGSTVFLDDQPGLNATDNNGVQDGGEPGIAGVAVELWSVGADGVKGTADDSKFEAGPDGVLGTADDGLGDHVTNASGNYLFSGIPEGIYYVKIQSTQFASGGPLAGSPLSSAVVNGTPEDNTDSDNNGVQMGGQGGMVMSNPVTLIAGTEPVGGAEPGQGGTQDDAHPYADANGNMTVDFGFVPAVSVGSVVFADYDNDGVYEPSDGENGISGVVLELYSPGANGIKENGGGDDVLVGTTTTDATGVYFFGGLYEGPYYILIGNSQFGTGNALSGHVSSSDIGTTATDNTTDNDDNGLAMGLVGTPSYVVMSPLFNLVAGTEPVGTAENGPGGTQDDSHPQVDANGDMTKDFGFVPTLSLGSTVWLDDQPGLNATDNNGMQDSGEPGISGVTVRLYGVGSDGIKGTVDDVEINVGPDGVLGTADDGPGGMLTDATGNYFFTSLLPGNYYVVLPSSNFASGGPLGSYQLSSTPNNPNDDQMDSDNNGLQMGGPGGVVMSGVITLASGTEPAGEPGQGGNQDAGNDDSGDMTVDFGFVPMVTLGSTVFLDDQPGLNATDNNGVQDGGEPGIAGVAVELWSVGADGVKGTADDSKFEAGPDGVLGTADDGLGDHVTNASGNYLFSGIPEGIYYVKIQSTQFASGGPLAGSPLSSAVVNGTPEDNTDSDNNGVQMGGQGGMVMSNPVTLIAGTEPVGGAEPGQGGTQDDAHPYADANGNMTVDFGFVPAVSVGSVVFADYDNDGVYEPSDGENGISGVVLELYSPGANGIKENGGGDDVLVGTTTTDATGVYFFGGLYEGPYYILIGNSQFGTGNALSGHVSSSDIGTTATDNTTDNDDNGLAMGLVGTPSYVVMSPLFNLVAGTEPVGTAENGPGGTQDDSHPQVDANGDMTKDFGFVPTLSLGSTVWLDDQPGLNATDNNGMQDSGEPGISGVTVRLYGVGSDGIKGTVDDVEINVGPDGVLGTADDGPGGMLTDATGNYFFTSLLPGNYYVVLPASNFASGGPLGSYQLSSTPNNPNDDQMDSDNNGLQMGGPGGVVMSGVITLASGTEPAGEPGQGGNQDAGNDDSGDMTVDFGFVPMVTLGSTVFLDDQPGLNATDNNGVQDAGEPGIAGVAVELWSVGADGVKGTADDSKFEVGPDGVLGTADDGLGDHVTNASGNYLFSGIPEGIYYVKIQSTQFASGGPLAGSPLSSAVVNGTPEDNTDSDNNGVQMGGQGGMVMSNPVTLIAGTEPVGGAEPGQGGTQDDAHPYADANGNMTVDFGFVPAVSVGSTVFLDINNSGIQDLNEPGIAGVEMTLYDVGPDKIRGTADDGGIIATTITNSSGDYFFGGLYEGNYIIIIDASQFGAGMSLETVPLSSVPTNSTDDTTDNDDNGIQAGGQGTETVSPVFMLMAGMEPTGAQEDGQGGTQDDAHPHFDANGDMTKDFGFVPIRFDLALYKTLAPGQPSTVRPGDTIYYRITVVNQGNLAADNIVITDYVPANMSFEFGIAPQNANWLPASNVTGPSLITRTLSVANGALPLGGLAIGATITVDLALTITSPLLPPGTVLTNLAEISAATDQFGVVQTDVDSDPDNNPNNDNYLVDNDINGNGKQGGDEDDHDPAFVTITGFDLALIKLLAPGQASAVQPGDTIHYRIRVINQGQIPADNILVTDYVPAQMTFETGITGNAGWAIIGGLLQRTLNVGDELPAGGLLPGDSVEVSLYLTLNAPLPAGQSITNFAEISAATDENGDPQDDVDSTPDVNPNNDNYINDNDVSGNGNNGEDEDDHDGATITTLRFDLALIKLLATNQPLNVQPGDTIHYRIRVINQGAIAANNIVISDYVPAQMIFEPGITGNAGWTLAGPSLLQRTLNIGDELPAGGLLPGQQVEVSLFLTLNAPLPSGIRVRNFAEITSATDQNGDPQVDVDSTPDSNPNNDVVNNDNDVSGNGNAGEDEDDHDYADVFTRVFDLALIKLLATSQPLNVQPGDTIHYRIRVINQGQIPANNILITDYVPTQMTFEPGITGNAGWAIMGGLLQRTLNIGDELPAGGLLPGDSVEVSLFLTLNAPLPSGIRVRNFAEITSATDQNGDPQVDVDSTPDNNPNNDVVNNDNDVSGNGNAGEDEDDHDYADVFTRVFDLALIKLLATNQPLNVQPGDTIHYRIRVINQGAIAANNIVISDYVPAQMIFEPGITGNAGWTLAGPSLVQRTLNIGDELPAGGLLPGQQVEVSLFLTLNAPLPSGIRVRNFAEITSATDQNGDPQIDVDSTPDSNPNNDVVNNDNDVSGNGNAGEDEDDHDYADVFTRVFDLALIKLLATNQPLNVQPGDTIHYRIRVINQGQIPADSILVTDYYPLTYLFFEPGIAGNANWFVPMSFSWPVPVNVNVVQRWLTVAGGDLPPGGLLPGQQVEVSLFLTLTSPLPPNTRIRNFAEITSATDENGDPQQDVDSTPDGVRDNDVVNNDNDVSGNGNLGEDEDDHDYADVFTRVFDLALIKELGPGQSPLVQPGDTVTFRILVLNQGTIPADNILLTDYVPNGMTFSPALNPGWLVNTFNNSVNYTMTVANGNLPAGGLPPLGTAFVDIRLIINAPLTAGTNLINWAEISGATDQNGDPQVDIDSETYGPNDTNNDPYFQDNEISGNGLGGEDMDDHDQATVIVRVFDLALYKTLSPGQPMVVRPGDTVSYTITVVNQGTIPANNIQITDYVPNHMFFDGPLNPGWTLAAGRPRITLTVANGLLPAGGLLPGQSASVVLRLILDAPLPPGLSLRNFAEISAQATDQNGNPQVDVDSSPDTNPNNDLYLQDNYIDGNGLAGGDEDDHDGAEIVTEFFDLALYKQRSPGQPLYVNPGDTLSFTITVVNQGMIPADNIQITDYLPATMFFDAALNPQWQFIAGRPRITLRVSNGLLPAGGLLPGQSASVVLRVILANPLPPNTTHRNFAEISSATDANGTPQQDVDSSPDGNPNNDLYLTDDYIDGNGLLGGDEDDHDGAEVITNVFDLALVKVLSPGQDAFVSPGDTVSFTITVFNQGSIAANNIIVTDYVPANMSFSAALNPGWTLVGGRPTRTLSVANGLLPAGGLAPGTTVSVTIRLIVASPLQPGTQLVNRAEISGATDANGGAQTDVDSAPDTNPDNDPFYQDNEISGNGLAGEDEDDHDIAVVTIKVFDLALIKTLGDGQSSIVNPRDTVKFDITVINQGQIPADNITITDYVPAGMQFVASINPGWTLVGGRPTRTISVAGGQLPAGGLLPGYSYTVSIFLVVNDSIEQGTDLLNFAEISSATDAAGNPVNDIDSTPDANPNNDIVNGDNNVTGNGLAGGDEDDHDFALVDVACYKTPGQNTTIQVCRGCSASSVVVDFFGSLNGHPSPGGVWADLDNTGLNLSNPRAVTVTGLQPGNYRFSYTIPAVNNCAARTAILTVQVVSIENLICNANVNISLGENCTATITADAILQGNIPCFSAFQVDIIHPITGASLGNTITAQFIGQTLFVKVFDPQCNNHCWGTIKVEDKVPPVITCPPNTSQATVTETVQYIDGALTTTDPQFVPVNWGCFLDIANPAPGNHYYDTYTFTVSQPDVYTFSLRTQWNDGIVALFQGPFNPNEPCENMIAEVDDNLTGTGAVNNPFDPTLRLTLPLQPGVTYTLLTTSFGANVTGTYRHTVFSDGDGLVTGLPTSQLTGQRSLICTDINQILNNPNSPQFTGVATAVDNCANPVTDITFTDLLVTNGGSCQDAVILRRWSARDNYGNASECVQEIRVRKARTSDVILPPFTVTVDCDVQFPTTANGNPHPSLTGYPFLYTAFGIQNLNETYCNLAAQYQDEPRIDVCAGSYKFIRRWTVFNWCDPASSLTYRQLIKVGDFTAPQITCPTVVDAWGNPQNPPVYSTGPFACTATINVPMPVVSDNCSTATVLTEVVTLVNVPVLNQYGQQIGTTQQEQLLATIMPGQNRTVTNVPIGNNHFFRYIATDACGNSSVLTCPFRVRDEIEPNAVCNDQLNVSLNGGGTARVFATDLDEGSNDNCGLAEIKVRRRIATNEVCAPITATFSDWADFVDFNCCDAGQRVRIELRVTDVSGNTNICWQEVLVEDKIRPFCHAPHNLAVNCNDLPYDFNPTNLTQLRQYFGEATAEDNCFASVQELAPIVNLHDCGWGTIIRRFRATDGFGNISANQCQQVITINEVHNYEIRFPRDAEANCGVASPDTILFNEIACDLLAVSVHDDTLSASGTECYKILRTYRVINWCEYDGQSSPIIVGRDEDCDNNPGDEHIWVLVRPNGVTYYDRDNAEGNNAPAAFSKATSCDGQTNPAGHWTNSNLKPSIRSRGYWQYTQHIKVYDNVRPTVTIPPVQPFCSYDSPTQADPVCEGPVQVPFTVQEVCTPNDVTVKVFLDAFNDGVFPYDYNARRNPNGAISGDTSALTIQGSYPNYTVVSQGQGWPIGTHKLEIHAEDGCGNATSASVIIEVRDCKAPTPICHNGLTVTLMGVDSNNDGVVDGGMAAVWATDFIASPITDCSMPVRYSIRRAGQAPDINRTGVNFSCTDYNAADGTQGTLHLVYVDAWDNAGNRDFCETYVRVQDQSGVCTGPAQGSIAGTIRNEAQQPVQGVEVSLSGPMTASATTPVSGAYLFSDLEPLRDYTVTPVLDRNYLNGVTTFDLVLIQRHILTVQPLDSPYKMIAADANSSGSITTSDVIILRRLILNVIDDLPNNTSWRFVPRSYVFPVPTNPWFEAFPEVINVNDLDGAVIGQDFVAVKVGDVNGSAVPNATVTSDRSTQGRFFFELEEQRLKGGERVEVPVRGRDMERILGYQLTLGFDRTALSLEDIKPGVAQEGNFGLRFAGEGLVTMSWHDLSGHSQARSDQVLFTLVFRADAPGMLSDLLRVESSKTAAEAYDREGRRLDIGLRFGVREVAQDYALYQNQPNPYNESTIIRFYLPQAGEATLTITDVRGRVLKVVKGEYGAGLHQIELDGQQLPVGVLQYTLTSGTFTATRKMVRTK